MSNLRYIAIILYLQIRDLEETKGREGGLYRAHKLSPNNYVNCLCFRVAAHQSPVTRYMPIQDLVLQAELIRILL